MRQTLFALGLAAVAMIAAAQSSYPVKTQSQPDLQRRTRARDLGVVVGVLSPGPLNAITDVEGVMVGHTTVIRGDNVRTGVTAVMPHGGNLFREKVPAAVFVGNGNWQIDRKHAGG